MSLRVFYKRFIEQPNVSEVFFNPELAEFIRDNKLNKDAFLKSRYPRLGSPRPLLTRHYHQPSSL
jgi:hypothetical protein